MNKSQKLKFPYNVEDHRFLVIKIARTIYNQHNLPCYIDLDDLIQEGMIGLLDAHGNYNAENSAGASLSTYASIRIRGSILDFIRSQSFTSRQLNAEIKIINNVSWDFFVKHEREPLRTELSNLTGLSLSKIENIISAKKYTEVHDTSEDGNTIEMSLLQDFSPESEIDVYQQVQKWIKSLSLMEQNVVSLYYAEGLTLAEIATIINMTPARVSQLLSKSKNLLSSVLNSV
ncbi:sigma-70 family RNA polymerase sigma factor [Photobacterium phosphoreum]|uniref:sigma-70 family RNA polymerase sigma factor n=1 Tax=Photobacterium phosphoreum TaxID=659 RepID=UPI0039AE9BC3